ncbi:PAS domain-containing protein [Methylobacterium sp. NPDC080182]|uniref:PAS domain-containing protein n=1 Tax=Methylobacterium sp. NPDC080182 TaxID=3390590 RepID=UPI003D02F4D1
MPTRRASSYQLLKLLEATGQIGVWSLDLRTGEMRGSAGLAHITGLPPDESPRGLLDSLLHPDDREVHGEMFDMLCNGRAIDHTVRIVRPDRTVRWIAVKAQIALDADYRATRAEGTAFDVTGPHEARLLAEQSTARYRGIVHAIAAVVWTTSPNGAVRPSPTWQALTGQSGPEMQGDGWLAAVHAEDRVQVEAAWRAAVERVMPYEVAHRVLCADGKTGRFKSYATPLHNPDGSVREWIGIMQRIADSQGLALPRAASSPPELNGALVRGARAMLSWSAADLAAAAGVSVASVRRLEEDAGTVRLRTREAIRQALEAAGVAFVATDGKAGALIGSPMGSVGESEVHSNHAKSTSA